MKNGEQYKFGLFLNSLYGASTAFDLMQQAKVTLKIKDFELIEKIDYYKKMNVNIK